MLAQATGAPQNPAPQTTPPATTPYQLQLPVPLVVEDVIVLDRNDRPVHGLKASDFVVAEDGKPMAPRNFEEHVAAPTLSAPLRPLNLGPNVFTNLPRVAPSRSLNILLLDGLNTPLADQAYVRLQMVKYIKELSPDTRMAIFGLGTRLYLLQGFTSDPAVLRAAIEGKRSAQTSSLLDEPVSGEPTAPLSDTVSDALSNMLGSDPTVDAVIANLQQFEAEQQTQMARLRMIYTLEAMNQLARYLSALPGHKNLIWFSGSFPLNFLPDGDLQDPFAAVADFQDDVRQTADLLARSRVAVYPVDARGLFNNPAFSASSRSGGMSMSRNGRMSMPGFASTNSKFFAKTTAEHATMDVIADETGGKAFYNTNGLKEAVEKAVDYGENYYTIAYTPSNQKWNGAYRKISIKAGQPELHLYFRHGYFADDANATLTGKKVLPQSAMQMAMLRGGPDAAQVLFDVMLVPAEKPGDGLSPGAHPDAKLMKPPYRSYIVQFIIDLHSLQMAIDAQGAHHGAAELVALVYDRDGALVNSAEDRIAINLTADRFAQVLKQGAMTHFTVEAPVKGEYFLRIGVHDLVSDRVGALEVPVSSLKSFRQMQAAAAKAQGAEEGK